MTEQWQQPPDPNQPLQPGPPPVQAPLPQQPIKKNRRLLIGGLVALAVLVWLGSCGAIIGALGGDDGENTAAAPSTSPAAQPTVAPSSEPAPTPEDQPTAEEPEPEPESWRPNTEVDWENYSSRVKKRIDRLGEQKDCDDLQTQFDNADMNDAAQRSRTGDGNADLMGYINDWMQHANCY